MKLPIQNLILTCDGKSISSIRFNPMLTVYKISILKTKKNVGFRLLMQTIEFLGHT